MVGEEPGRVPGQRLPGRFLGSRGVLRIADVAYEGEEAPRHGVVVLEPERGLVGFDGREVITLGRT